MTDDKQRKTPVLRFKGFHDDWEQRKLENISEIITGGTPSTKIISYWQPSEINWLSSGEINKRIINDSDRKISKKGLENSSAKLIPKDTVLIALAGQGKTRGKVAITNINTAINQSLAGIKLNKPFSNYFLFYELSKKYQKLRQLSSGNSTRGGLNKKLISSLHITFSTNKEQKKIANLLSLVDHLISLQQRKIDNLYSKRKGLLEEFFNPKNIKDEKIIKLNKVLSVPTEEPKKISDTSQILTVKLKTEGIIKGASRSTLKIGSTKYFVRHSGQFIFGKQNFFNGSMAIIPDNCDGMVSSSDVPSLNINKKIIDPFYLWLYLSRPDFYKNSERWATGTGSKRLHVRTLLNFHIRIPNMNAQIKIVKIFKNYDQKLRLQEKKLEDLQRLKKYFLQNMFI